MSRDISCNLGANVTGIGFQFFDASGLIGSRVTSSISNPGAGVYYKAAQNDAGAIGVHWDNTAGDVTADEIFETNANPVNVTKIAGQTASAAAGVTFPASIGTSTFAGGAVASVTGAVGSVTAGVLLAASQSLYAPAKAGDAMTLTSGERTATANEVEAQIIDDTDSEKVLTAITDKIASVNPSLGGLTVSAIASAAATSVWAAGTRSLTDKAGFAISGTITTLDALNTSLNGAHGSGSWATATGFSTLTAAGVRAAVGMAAADLDTQLAAILAASGGGTTPPTASAIAIAVVDQTLSGHQTAGTVGGALVAAGNAGDPWAAILPDSYTGHQAGKILSRLDITPYTAPVATIPAPANGNQTYGYVYTRDGHGALQAACRVTFQMTAGNNADSFSSIQFAALSDADGLLSVLLEKGAAYRARRGSSGEWVAFTAGSGDSFALPAILGTP